ncbi:FAD binding domain-containing protein [Spongiactinospora sp. TRM90649]|uniref:FAD binding domain-containing protein n=1 Tax=Spongiactinospora sp. TRM90649 TaxID=3031114 RepID=UPI0023F7EE1F|nr:FAD binding domain-containing protein [Spongiactinospora sp. TRM90649]MDF5757563.1 FAD binding domain-containing protein [Spongiactinospora sp. TRM90649]
MTEQHTVFIAGGTDLMSRAPGARRIDVRDRAEPAGITWRPDGSARIGALTTLAELAGDERLRAAYPSLALTAAGLATPQIRAVGTLGGNLLQRNRCAYFRNPAFSCHQDGGDSCPASRGVTRHLTVVRGGPCLAPHPSSLAMALFGFEAMVDVEGRGPLPINALYGDDPTRDHLLDPGEALLALELPAPMAGERGAYFRAIGRAEAEWPLAEAAARVVVAGGSVVFAAVTAGGVARTPLRLTEVEEALLAGEPVASAAARAAARCDPPKDARYKVALLTGVVEHVLEVAISG